MSKLEKLAVRIGEISNDISEQESRRAIKLSICHCTNHEDFVLPGTLPTDSCLLIAYEYVKESRALQEAVSFGEILEMYGCKNCIGAYDAKKRIGLLKQERGRLVGNISTIGKSLRG